MGKNTNKKNIKSTVIAIVVTALIVALIGGALFSVISKSMGVDLRDKVSAESANVQLDNAVMSYFIRSNYNNFVSMYGDYISMFGIDTSLPLKSQNYSGSETWFDFFVKQTKFSLEEAMALAEQAKSEGIENDDADKAEFEDFKKQMKDYAAQNGFTLNQYVSQVFGAGVKISDVEKGYMLSSLGQKYYEKLMDEYEYTDEDIYKYRDENKNDYLKAGIMKYELEPQIAEDATDEEKATANESTKIAAEQLKAATTKEEFETALRPLIAAPDTDEETVNTAIEDAYNAGYMYSSNDGGASEWIFADGRAVGDSTVIEGADGKMTVYLVTKTAYFDEESTLKNVRHILFALENYDSDEAAKAKADEVLNMWLEGEKTEDSFAALATEYTEDPGSQTTGGLYEDVKNGDMVTEFNDWLFDSSRTLGDYGIVKTSYGYHIMYFAGDGEAQWKADVEQAMKSDYYSEKLEEYKKAHPVTFYDEIISEIDM